MHQKGLQGIAGCRVVNLGVNHHLDGGCDVCGRVDVDVADTVGMAQNGNSRVLLDVAHLKPPKVDLAHLLTSSSFRLADCRARPDMHA